MRGLGKHLFRRCSGPVLILGVHLCGTLSLRAVDLFNQHPQARLLILKPCCLPGMVQSRVTMNPTLSSFALLPTPASLSYQLPSYPYPLSPTHSPTHSILA